MNQRLFNLTKWSFLEEGQAIVYHNPKRRTVILDVNCPDEVSFYVRMSTEDIEEDPARQDDVKHNRLRPGADRDAINPVVFLAVCKGRDQLEFAVEGEFSLMVEGGNAYVYTQDSSDISFKEEAPLIFTRIANRRQRNPQQEWIEYKLRENQRRMFEQLAAESDRRIQAIEAKYEQYLPDRDKGTPVINPVKVEGRSPGAPEPRADDAREVAQDGDKATGDKPRKKVDAPKLDHDQ